MTIRLNLDCRRHLLGTGREAEALRALSLINGVPEDDPIVKEAVDELMVAINAENEVSAICYYCHTIVQRSRDENTDGVCCCFFCGVGGEL